jgi:hypothetical protein
MMNDKFSYLCENFLKTENSHFMENTSENNIVINGEELSPDDIRQRIIFSEIINKKAY